MSVTPDEGRTHWHGCEQERGHHACALAELARLRDCRDRWKSMCQQAWNERDDTADSLEYAEAELARLRAELAEWQTMNNSLRAELEREAKRLAFLFQAHRTTSNALVEAELRVFNGESLTLDEARTAIDEAMRCTLAQEPPA